MLELESELELELNAFHFGESTPIMKKRHGETCSPKLLNVLMIRLELIVEHEMISKKKTIIKLQSFYLLNGAHAIL